MGIADDLLDLIFEWMEAAADCSSNLRALAEELESLRQKCNAVETVSSTVAATVTVLSFLAAPFTGGASLALGAVVGGVGAGVSVITKLIEAFESSDKLKRVQEIDSRSNIIISKMQILYGKLRSKCPSGSGDEMDKYVVMEILKAILRRSGRDVGLNINDLDQFVTNMMDGLLQKTFSGSPLDLLVVEVIGVLTVFSLKLGGSVLPTIAAAGGVQIGKTVIGAGASAALLGVVGLGINLYESVNNWKELIKNNHETEASKSLRDMAKKIDKVKSDLSDKLSQIEKLLKEAIKKHLSSKPQTTDVSEGRESEEDAIIEFDEFESSSEVEEVLKMALQNFNSLSKLLTKRKGFSPAILWDLLQRNNLDVLLITETWIKVDNLPPDVLKRLLPDNYSMYHVPRPLDLGKKGGGGVAIIHRKDLACEPVLFQRTWTFEYAAVVVKTPRSNEPLLILNIYRSLKCTVAQFVENFLTEFESLLSEVDKRYKHVVIGGDFNIWVDTLITKARKFEEITVGNHLIQHVTCSTHNRGHILDLILAKPNVRITVVSVDDTDFSDHSTVIFIAKLRIRKNKSKRHKKN